MLALKHLPFVIATDKRAISLIPAILDLEGEFETQSGLLICRW